MPPSRGSQGRAPQGAPSARPSRGRAAAPLARADALPVVSVADDGPLGQSGAQVVAVALRSGDGSPVAGPEASAVAAAGGADVDAALARAQARGSAGEVVDLPLTGGGPERLLIVGTGGATPLELRRAGAALARRAAAPTLATTLVAGADPAGVRAGVEGVLAAAYRAPRRGLTGTDESRLRSVRVVLPRGRARAAAEEAVRRGVVTARALAVARDLANTPADLAGPVELAREAERLGAAAGLEVRVRDETDLRDGGFGGLLAVGSGSARPPRLVELSYAPQAAGPRARHVVLVGKGIAYDSGGLSLKPREAMVPMKTDMAGAGAVLAAMTALPELGVRVRVTALLAIAENLPSGSAYRPGDVVTHYGGRTTEVLNTDAEGRMVLADALAYADAELAPDLVVDLATLTGAASLGLGRRHGALFATDEALAASLLAAADASGERLWRMPLVEDYLPALRSPVADLAHVPHDSSVGGGAITAALFLRSFTGGRPWAHLDIAGPARADGDEHEVTKGGTGFGARLLLRWLETAR
ncbi:leucyl aminopeptidase [Motilibacter rhizosphaerae]|uniref:Probable cytosol aminopeptidase n=1 Tax=Motilibacter rhizosphaerae TaxID=598652 RepID=A0A4Q7NQ84_9ACTN|nr:M17 family peptidase N-terminal domain-containing protein [Motilibacter rhizosphaerae]RZS87248.1 leucyl aminopeptidase [Motilibacter rhizosphaerae]